MTNIITPISCKFTPNRKPLNLGRGWVAHPIADNGDLDMILRYVFRPYIRTRQADSLYIVEPVFGQPPQPMFDVLIEYTSWQILFSIVNRLTCLESNTSQHSPCFTVPLLTTRC